MPEVTRVFVVAEAGVNHNGSVEFALDLVDAAARAGADAVKFQTFRADALASPLAPKAGYQERTTGGAESQRDMLRKLELDERAHRTLKDRCRARGVTFLSTPFDLDSLALLVRDHLDVPMIKIGSGDLTNGPLIHAAARTGKPLILSTGMATVEEIESALGLLAWTVLGERDPATPGAQRSAYASAAGRSAVAERATLLQCTTDYPAAAADLNLRAMQTLKERFGTRVGFSDHSTGIAAAIAAAALGAALIEKHLTLDRGMPGPDHAASLEPADFATMVACVREVEQALGSADKRPAASELANVAAARKSLVAARPVRTGEPFSAENLAVMRPGGGISPMRYWEWLGKVATRDYAAGELIKP
jgi:N-acetylneuraminate synthase